MLDLIGTTVLTAVIAVNLNAAIVTMPLSATEKLTTVTIAGSGSGSRSRWPIQASMPRLRRRPPSASWRQPPSSRSVRLHGCRPVRVLRSWIFRCRW